MLLWSHTNDLQSLWSMCVCAAETEKKGDAEECRLSLSVCVRMWKGFFLVIAREHCLFPYPVWRGHFNLVLSLFPLRPQPPAHMLRHQHQQSAVTLNKSHQSSSWQGLALLTNPPNTPSALLINHSLSDENKGGKKEQQSHSLFCPFSRRFSATTSLSIGRPRLLSDIQYNARTAKAFDSICRDGRG